MIRQPSPGSSSASGATGVTDAEKGGRTMLPRRTGLGPAIAALASVVIATSAMADCGTATSSDAALIAAPRAVAALAEADATLANPTGRLWRVETEPPSYLVGTFHIAADGIDIPGPRLSRLVKNARRLFVEVDTPALTSALSAWMADPSRLFRPAGERLADHLSPAERVEAEAVLGDYGLPFIAADELRPFVLIGLLSLPPCAMKLAGMPGLDAALERVAASHGVPVSALETVEEQLAALEGDAGGMDQILRMMFAQAQSYQDDWFLYLALYRTRNIGAIWALGLQSMRSVAGEETDAIAGRFWEQLVGSRNRRMVARLEPGLREGGAVVAVGALHLPGGDGLVALLRNEGFTVVPERDDPGSLPTDAGSGASSTEASPDTSRSSRQP